MKLIYQMMLAGLLGFLFGNLVNPSLIASIMPLGDIYISLLKAGALPLIFFSLISGMTSLADLNGLYRVGFRSITAFLITGVVAALIGISASWISIPSRQLILSENSSIASSVAVSLKTFLVTIIPNNFFGAFTADSSIQVTLLALLMAIAILALPRKEKKIITTIVQSANKLFLEVIKIIMLLSPLTVFIFAAHLTTQFEKQMFQTLINFLITLFVAYIFQYFLLGLYIKYISKLPCLPFFFKSFEYQLIALTTGSSKATLPFTIQIANKKMGISSEKASFILPLGATINMDGLSIYLSLSTLFVANSVGLYFSFEDYLLLIFASSLMAIGTAGIPGGALAMLPILFSIWHLPYEYIPLFIAIDPLINMFRSALNITGDVAVTLILDKLFGELEIETYNNMRIS